MKVKFGEMVLWLLGSIETGGALAPLEHVDDKGDIKDWDIALSGESYAHLGCDGKIRRFHEVIGTREDLIPCQSS